MLSYAKIRKEFLLSPVFFFFLSADKLTARLNLSTKSTGLLCLQQFHCAWVEFDFSHIELPPTTNQFLLKQAQIIFNMK